MFCFHRFLFHGKLHGMDGLCGIHTNGFNIQEQRTKIDREEYHSYIDLLIKLLLVFGLKVETQDLIAQPMISFPGTNFL